MENDANDTRVVELRVAGCALEKRQWLRSGYGGSSQAEMDGEEGCIPRQLRWSANNGVTSIPARVQASTRRDRWMTIL